MIAYFIWLYTFYRGKSIVNDYTNNIVHCLSHFGNLFCAWSIFPGHIYSCNKYVFSAVYKKIILLVLFLVTKNIWPYSIKIYRIF